VNSASELIHPDELYTGSEKHFARFAVQLIELKDFASARESAAIAALCRNFTLGKAQTFHASAVVSAWAKHT
jgi:hypothetical protein